MNKGYKFRIYPSAEQSVMFEKTFGCVRFVYNRMLSDKWEKKKSGRINHNSDRRNLMGGSFV